MGFVSVKRPSAMETEPEAHCIAEHLDTDAAVRTLLAERLERWRTERAIEQLQNGEVMFSRAAEMTGLSLWDFPT